MLDRGASFIAPDLVMRGPTAHADGLVVSRVKASELIGSKRPRAGTGDSVRAGCHPPTEGSTE